MINDRDGAMRQLPPGFQLHNGLDGLIAGLTLVFIVKVETVVSDYIRWSALPMVGSAIRDTKFFFVNVWNTSVTIVDQIAQFIHIDGSSGGSTSNSVSKIMLGELGSIFIEGLIKLLGFAIPIVGVRSATLFEQALVILGVWIAILLPLWYWVLQPTMYWWQERENSTQWQ